jgi:hypothetical protein
MGVVIIGKLKRSFENDNIKTDLEETGVKA